MEMGMCEDDMGCCCYDVNLNSKAAGGYGQRLHPKAMFSGSPSRSHSGF